MPRTCGPMTPLYDRVVFAHPENGTPDDREHAKAHLNIGQAYIVRDTVVLPFETWLKFFGVPGQQFNSVLFCPERDYSPPPILDPEDDSWDGRAI